MESSLCIHEFSDYIPVVSTFSNVVRLGVKLARYILKSSEPSVTKNTQNVFTRDIDKKPVWRCIVAAVPLIGNGFIIIFDLIAWVKKAKSSTEATVISGTVNQYNEKGEAACTRIACQFLNNAILDKPATSESIDRAVKNHGHFGNNQEDIENVIPCFDELKPFIETQTSKEAFIAEALPELLNDPKCNAAIITSFGITIAIRKQGGMIEIFDSHGDRDYQPSNNAYVYRCNQREAIAYMQKKFPILGELLADTLNYYRFKLRK